MSAATGGLARVTATAVARVVMAAGASLTLLAAPVAAQADSTMAQDGLYDRPFIGGVGRTSIGGYVEGNTNYFVEDGVSEGFSMELRRFNVFLFSQVSSRIRFLSELEFEHGTAEIALETALVDFEVSPALVLRGGILLPPLGYFNQNHDSPRWDFVERPLVSTDIIPSTLSEVGFGLLGRVSVGSALLSYDAYLTNGLGQDVVGNGLGRTDIPSGKGGEGLAEDNNASPAVSARVALRLPAWGEVGLSHYRGHYNSYVLEGVEVDERRMLAISALDFGASLGAADLRGELAYASIDVPPSMREIFGDTQWGGHLDVVVPVWRPRFAGYDSAVLAVALRLEHVDYNVGDFESTGRPIFDDVTAVVPGVSFRPTDETVLRVNYRYHWTRDFPGNPTSEKAGVQVGLATYF